MTPADKEMVRDVVRDKSYLAYPMTKKLLDALDEAEAESDALEVSEAESARLREAMWLAFSWLAQDGDHECHHQKAFDILNEALK